MDKIIISEDRYGPKFNHFENDDFIDRLNSRYTVMVLTLCILVVTGKLYVGNSINCWTPAQFTGSHNEYTNSICWLKGSYYLPADEITIPDRSKPRTYYISFYQWTPFILLVMTSLFFLPRLLWHALTKQGGLDIQRIVKTIKDQSDADKGVDYAKQALKSFLTARFRSKGSMCCRIRCNDFYSGFTVMYFSVKLLYIINTVSQFFLLNTFLAFHFNSYGVDALSKLFSREDWFESPRFPRVTMCDFMIRHLGSNQHWYAIQCNLPINLYNEKIFFGIWIWLIVLTILNILSTLGWFISLLTVRRKGIIATYLGSQKLDNVEEQPLIPPTSNDSSLDSEYLDGFVTEYLQLDGFLTFRLIAHNTDDIVAGKIIRHLYSYYAAGSRTRDSSV